VGGKQQKEIRDQKADALVALLKQAAAYVSMIANGDVAVMLGAGFRTSKIPSPGGIFVLRERPQRHEDTIFFRRCW
jgi:hypothetical protein